MAVNPRNLRLMAVHAHPDDEASKGAATTAHYRARGAGVKIITCTGGERGDIQCHVLAQNPEVSADIGAWRRREMAAAARALDIEHAWLGFEDSGYVPAERWNELPEGVFAQIDPQIPTDALIREIRSYRPHVITTYNEQGGYPHPDHVRTHEVSLAAWELAADGSYKPELGAPWAAGKLYYDVSFHPRRAAALNQAMRERGLPEAYGPRWFEVREDRRPREITAQIHCAEHFETRDRALRAHASQVTEDSMFFAVPRDIEASVWPWEDFELARSRVEVSGFETDLFNGISGDDGE